MNLEVRGGMEGDGSQRRLNPPVLSLAVMLRTVHLPALLGARAGPLEGCV